MQKHGRLCWRSSRNCKPPSPAKSNTIGPPARVLSQLDKQKQADNLKTAAVMAQVKEVEADNRQRSGGRPHHQRRRRYSKGGAQSGPDFLHRQQDWRGPAYRQHSGEDDDRYQVAGRARQAGRVDLGGCAAGHCHQRGAKADHEEGQQIDRLKQALATAKQTPYYLSVSGGRLLYFAFVPYDNQRHISIGTAVYDCYLNMVLCRKVGTVKQVFAGEEHAIHPIFRTDIRGFLIQMQLDNPESAKSKTVFLNRKPLLF